MELQSERLKKAVPLWQWQASKPDTSADEIVESKWRVDKCKSYEEDANQFENLVATRRSRQRVSKPKHQYKNFKIEESINEPTQRLGNTSILVDHDTEQTTEAYPENKNKTRRDDIVFVHNPANAQPATITVRPSSKGVDENSDDARVQVC